MVDRSGHGRGELIREVVARLTGNESESAELPRRAHDVPMPSVESLAGIMELLKSLLFPGYFGPSDLRSDTLEFHLGATLDRVAGQLWEQVRRGFCYACVEAGVLSCRDCDHRAHRLTDEFIARLPEVHRLLRSDVEAAYIGDPAATRRGETIYCYPSIKAMLHHRVAHELHRLEVPLIPRIVAELSHSQTGIDIHPGARIGASFFMDHGTGIVIGETAVIGERVRLYQGVTLGAKSFPLDSQGRPIKGIDRHPVVEDDVIIYSGATVLGRVRLGRGAVIGGNVWLTRDVPAGARVMQGHPIEVGLKDGAGI